MPKPVFKIFIKGKLLETFQLKDIMKCEAELNRLIDEGVEMSDLAVIID